MINTGSRSYGKNWGSDGVEGLPPTINIYPWEGTDHFLSIVDSESRQLEVLEHSSPEYRSPEHSSRELSSPDHLDPCDLIVFLNVSEAIFKRDFREETNLSKSWKSYDQLHRVLFVAMNTAEHTAAAQTFNYILKEAVDRMAMSTAVKSFAETAIKGESRIKKPDQAWGPKRPPPSRSRKWPTVVLEVGVSEPKTLLQRDASFWLNDSGGDVKIFLMILVNRRTPEILLEKWETSGGEATKIQEVVVWRDNNTTFFKGEPLVIEFQKLFLRLSEVPYEKDVTFDQANLKRLAADIWLEQGFVE